MIKGYLFIMIFSKRHFVFSWKMTILTFFFVSFFIYLGNWQLYRAKEKAMMIEQASKLTQQSPIAWHSNMSLPLQYQQIQLKGHYILPTIFLDNQHYLHQFGYHVITPLLINNNNIILIDRGWIKGDLNRRQLPAIVTPAELMDVTGQVYFPTNKEWVLGQEIEKKSDDALLIERINIQLLSQFLHKSIYPFIIRLNKDNQAGYMREWAIVSMPPARHKGYAFQWFAIAFAIFVIYIGLNFKKINEKI